MKYTSHLIPPQKFQSPQNRGSARPAGVGVRNFFICIAGVPYWLRWRALLALTVVDIDGGGRHLNGELLVDVDGGSRGEAFQGLLGEAVS